MTLKSDFLSGREKKEESEQGDESWVKRCEEAHGAEDAAREAENVFKISVQKCLAAEKLEEEGSKEVAEKARLPKQTQEVSE